MACETDTQDMETNTARTSRFVPGDAVIWNGHTATVACVDANGRYGIFTTDGSEIVEFGLFGRVLSAAK